MWGPLSLRAGPAGHTAGWSPIAGGEAQSCRKRKTDFITLWDTRGQTRASVWLLTKPYFVCKIRNEWMEVTESRFHLKRRQNPVPEELEPDMALELEDLRWIPGPSFIYTYIHIWVVQRCSLWDHESPTPGCNISLLLISLYLYRAWTSSGMPEDGMEPSGLQSHFRRSSWWDNFHRSFLDYWAATFLRQAFWALKWTEEPRGGSVLSASKAIHADLRSFLHPPLWWRESVKLEERQDAWFRK